MPNNSNRTKQITAIVSLLCFLASMNLPPALAQQALSGNPAPTIFGPHGPVSLSPLGTVAMPISVGRTHPSTFTPPSSSAAAPQFSPATFGASANAASGMQLDLSSAINNVVVDQNLLRGRSVMINVGGKTQAVSAGMNVTPAEFVAIKQALAGRQSLVLDTNGAAVGGNFRLNGIVTPSSGGIVIPAGVKGIDVAGSTSALKLSGNLVNFGSLFAVAGAPAVNTATIAANDINNELGATISTVAANAGLGLSQARPSRDTHSRRLADHLLKTSSILLFLSNKGQPYQQVLRKHEMAWLE